LYKKIIDEKIEIELKYLLPFLNDDLLKDLYERVIRNEITLLREEEIIPFLGSGKIKEIFKEYMNGLKPRIDDDEDEVNEENE